MAVICPLVVDLLDLKEQLSLVDLTEDDKNENKKELELKDLFFVNKIAIDYTYESNLFLVADFYVIITSVFEIETVSPPPETIA